MFLVRGLFCVFAAGCFLGAQSLSDDPVMKIRMQRSKAQGISEADLPPVPRCVMEPPPLPPPEVHAKDIPRTFIFVKLPKNFASKAVHFRGAIRPKLVSNRSGKAFRAVLAKVTSHRSPKKAKALSVKLNGNCIAKNSLASRKVRTAPSGRAVRKIVK